MDNKNHLLFCMYFTPVSVFEIILEPLLKMKSHFQEYRNYHKQ